MKTTQCEQILGFLSDGNRLTPLDALRIFGCARLAARINDLKKQGFNIDREIVEVETTAGHRAHVACYSMNGW